MSRHRIAALTIPVVLWSLRMGVAEEAEPPKPPATEEAPAAKETPKKGEPKKAEGEKETPPKEIEEVVVTATREKIPAFRAPANVSVISEDDIQVRRQSRTIPDAFAETPGVMGQKTAHGHGSPYIRGFTGFRNLLLIDGIRLNNSIFRDGPNEYWNTVDVQSIERLELVRGPSSVLYGSDAIGGTVNAITKGRHQFEEGFHGAGELYYRASTAEASHQGRAQAEANAGKQFGFFVGVSPKHFGNLDAGGDIGRQRKTGYEEFDCDAKIHYLPAPGHRLTFAYQRADLDDVWRAHRTIQGVSWHGSAVGTDHSEIYDYDRHLGYVKYEGDFAGSPVERVKATLSGSSFEQRMYRERSDDRHDRQGIDLDTFGVTTQLESPTPIGRFTYGTEYYLDRVGSFRRNWNADGTFAGASIQGPVADDSAYDLLGVYVQDTIPLFGKRLEVILGVRYTYAAADIGEMQDPETNTETSFDHDWHNVVGSGRFIWRFDPKERWSLFGGVSQGFRAPNLSDLSRLDVSRSGELETPAGGGLDPENFVNCEIGVRAKFGKFSFQTSYYYTFVDGMIMRTPTGNRVGTATEVRKKNAGEGFVQGIDIEASWRFHPMFTVGGGFAWLDGEVDTYATSSPRRSSAYLDKMMPPQGFGSVKWESLSRKFWAEFCVRAAGRADRLSPADERDTQRTPPGGTPGWATLNLRGGIQIYKGIDWSLSIENLLDKGYRIHGSGQNEPGFNVVSSLRWKF